MLLSSRKMSVTIPQSSTCIIKTVGELKDGDIVSVISPVFASADFQSGSIVTTETFDVPVYINNDEHKIVSDGNLEGLLESQDNDVFDMRVTVR